MGTNPWANRSGTTAPSAGGGDAEERAALMEEVRAEVREDIRKRFGDDKNPVTEFLLKVGVLEDMEVMRRVTMRTSDNKLIYQCGKKLDLLKTYIALAKETIVMQEKQQKIDASGAGADDKDEVIVSLERT